MTEKKRSSASSASYYTKKYDLLNTAGGYQYSLKSSNPNFDRLAWHAPEFVWPSADSYSIPLGNSAAEAVVSLYGLRYVTTYTGNLDQTWKDILGEYVTDPVNEDKARNLVGYLHAAATICYLRNEKGIQIDAAICNPTFFCQMCQSVEQYDLIDAFRNKN